MAEREGFEPPIPVKVCPLSRRIVSTTHAPLRAGLRFGSIANSDLFNDEIEKTPAITRRFFPRALRPEPPCDGSAADDSPLASPNAQHPLSDRRLFFFNDTATTEIYTLSLHDALPTVAAPAERL